ncbi:phosphate ABC transporter substrate-binding protein [Phocaeicola sp.]
MNQLKTLFLLLSLASVLNASAQRIKGSDTVLPVSQETAETFMNLHPEQRVTVTGGGTGVGISALMDNTTDIAMASRPIKFSEKMKLKAAKQEVAEVIIAYDALAVVVNPDNPVSRLTRQQLESIFRGKITNWKQLGGPDLKIIVYSRETSSGTYEFFKESALLNKNYMSGSLSMPATGAVIQSVSQTKGAIGYVGLAYLCDKVKPIAVSYDNGKNYVLPTPENGKKKLYPVVRPLYYYYNVANKDKVTPFIDYILSTEGQNIIKKGGYIPVK